MYMLGLGIILLLLKTLEIGPPAHWAWWWVLAPFALAAVWWAWADASGYTKRKAMQREDARKAARLARQKDALGLATRRKK